MTSAIYFGDANSGFQAGTINGPVDLQFHHHAPPERLERPPNPSALIPFSRDADFVEQEEILGQIRQKCAAPGSRTALVGLGGVGKSQLAIEYAYRTRERSPEMWVFWVHASNAARFEQSLLDIANYVKLPGRQNPKADIFQLVHDWLCEEREGKWTMILDNIDDASFFVEGSASREGQTKGLDNGNSRPLLSYFPQCQNGSVLITTRSKDSALKLVEQRDIIAVDPMNKADALALFKKKLRRHSDSDDVTELVTALEFMPLAIVQAAAYIAERAPRYSVRQYLEQFRKSDGKRTSLLDYEGGRLRRDREAKNSIIITWQISFDYIRQTRSSAGGLLSLMCFFDRQGIPEALLKSQNDQKGAQRDTQRPQKERDDDEWESDEDHSSQSSQSDEFEKDIVALRNFSFISINADGTTFEMHSLVQLAKRKWLKNHGQLERWKQQFIRNLSEELPTGEYENWAACQALFPHAKSAAVQRPQAQDSLRNWASILYKAAWYAWEMGNGAEAEKMSIQAMRVRKKMLGLEHEDSLSSMALVGLAYNLLGRWEEAEELEVQVIETCKKKLGADHPDTLTSMASLASTYWKQCRWDEATELLIQVTETRKKKLKADHPSTLTSMVNLASMYMNQGRWDVAEELQAENLELCKRKLGADHPDTLTIINNMAVLYSQQGREDEAKKLKIQVIETRKKKLGADHPDTLSSMANLASTYRDQGQWDAAEELKIQVMETRKKKLGADHPAILTSMGDLASVYNKQGRWEEAEGLGLQVMEMSKIKLGADHPNTLTSMVNLAFTYMNQGRWDEAEELQVEELQLRKRKLGTDHPSMLTSIGNLAATYRNQGRWEAAEELEMQVMETCRKQFGADHPSTLISMANLASTYWNQGR